MRSFEVVMGNSGDIIGDALGGLLRKFDSTHAAIAAAMGLSTSLRPEVSLMLELYEADRLGKKLTVSMLGLIDGIAPTTALRYIDLLEQNGALIRSPHERDNRMSYVAISHNAKRAIDNALLSVQFTESVSYKPTV